MIGTVLGVLVVSLGVGAGICAHRAGLFGGAARRGGFSVLPGVSVAPKRYQGEARLPPSTKKPSLPSVQIKRTRSFSRSDDGRSKGGGKLQSEATTTQAEVQGEAQAEAQGEVQGEVQREQVELHQWWSESRDTSPSSPRSSAVGSAPSGLHPELHADRVLPRDGGHDESQAAQIIQAGLRGASVRRDEKARRGWLLHHMETGNWSEAELLVVSAAEQAQLTHARERASPRDSPTRLRRGDSLRASSSSSSSSRKAVAKAIIPDSLREQVDTPNTYRRERQFGTREPSPTPSSKQESLHAEAMPAGMPTQQAAAAQGQRERPPMANPHGSLAASIQEHMLRQSPGASRSSSSSNTHLL